MLKRQLYIVYIIALFIPILLIGVYLLYNNYTVVYEHHESMLRSDNIRVKSIIFELTTSVTNICDSISESKEISKLLQNRYETLEDAEEALQEVTVLKDFYTRHTETASIFLMTNHPDLFTYDRIIHVDEAQQKEYEAMLKDPGYHWNIVKQKNNLGVEYIELEVIYPINIIQSPYDGVLKISVSGNYLKNRINNNTLDVDLTVNGGPIFYSTWGNVGRAIDFLEYDKQDFFSYKGVETYLNERRLLEVSSFQPVKSKDSIYVFSSDAEALERVRNMQLLILLTIFLSLLIPTIIIIKFTGELSNRVDTLRIQMHRVTGGDYQIIETFRGNDELVELFKDLKIMISSIKERDKKIFESRIVEQELMSHQKAMEMEILSSKINPHFLYNTLETIRMKALNSNDREVAGAVKLLGQYMRYNLEFSGELTYLKDELRFINLYVDIQSLRFQNRITSKITVDPDLLLEEVKILPLLIQPIIENAYIHGHKETIEGGVIHLNITHSLTDIMVEVEDNGTGMDITSLETIRTKLEQPRYSQRSIGLHNIHQRIKLFYGTSYGLTINSEMDHGTKISFCIPKK